MRSALGNLGGFEKDDEESRDSNDAGGIFGLVTSPSRKKTVEPGSPGTMLKSSMKSYMEVKGGSEQDDEDMDDEMEVRTGEDDEDLAGKQKITEQFSPRKAATDEVMTYDQHHKIDDEDDEEDDDEDDDEVLDDEDEEDEEEEEKQNGVSISVHEEDGSNNLDKMKSPMTGIRTSSMPTLSSPSRKGREFSPRDIAAKEITSTEQKESMELGGFEGSCIMFRRCILSGEVEKVKEVLETLSASPFRQAVIDHVNPKNGFSVLMIAVSCEKGKLDRSLIITLLEAGADPRMVDRSGNTALHWAAVHGQVEVLADLAVARDLLILANEVGDTPLHLASRFGQIESVRVLLKLFRENNLSMKNEPARKQTPKLEKIDVKMANSVQSVLGGTRSALPEALQQAKDEVFKDVPEDGHNSAATSKHLLFRNDDYETAFDAAGTDVVGRLNPQIRHEIHQLFFKESNYFKTLVLHHPDCFDHVPVVDEGRDTWEAPERLQAIMESLLKEPVEGTMITQEFKPASKETLLRAHAKSYVDMVFNLGDEIRHQEPVPFTPKVQRMVKEAAEKDIKKIDSSDTSFSAGSLDAALQASGSVCHAIDCVVKGQHRNAFCLVRPPGHHAGFEGLLDSASSCGFCIFNNVMVGAMHALEKFPDEIRKIAIIDFDVHHGNGTEEIVAKVNRDAVHKQRDNNEPISPPIMFFSSHVFDGQRPGSSFEFYPGSGQYSDVLGNIINAPMMPLWRRHGARRPTQSENPSLPRRGGRRNWAQRFYLDHFGRTEFRRIVKERLLPPLRAFQPDLVLVSAGFDAGRRDVGNGRYMGRYVSGFDLQKQDFAWIAGQISRIANVCCDGRVVSVLEGGYGRLEKGIKRFAINRTSLARNTLSHLKGLIDPMVKVDPDSDVESESDEEEKVREEKQATRRARSRKKPQRFENENLDRPKRRTRQRVDSDAESEDESESDEASSSRKRQKTDSPDATLSKMNHNEKREMALKYLRRVKLRYVSSPSTYKRFLEIMGDFKSRKLVVSDVIEEVKELFAGEEELMKGFNQFLPRGYSLFSDDQQHEE